MYTLKSIVVNKKPDAPVVGERLLLWVDAVFTDGITDTTIDFKAENKDVMDDTLRSIISRLNKRDEELQKINTSNYTIPEIVVPEVPVLTPEQIKKMAIAQKEQELNDEIYRAIEEKKRAEIAATDPEVAAKLAAYEAAKLGTIKAGEVIGK